MKKLELVVDNTDKEEARLDIEDTKDHPRLKLDWRGPTSTDWLSNLSVGTEFKCRDLIQGRRWQVIEFTHLGKLKGDVLLCPTVFIEDPKAWFWVDPVIFCKEWEFRGVIEIPNEPKED